MSTTQKPCVYRVDKFSVPATARDVFTEKVQATHSLLKKQPGFIQDFILEQTDGSGTFNFVTIVEWESMEAIEQAKYEVHKLHRQLDFDPKELLPRLGIKADLGNYKRYAPK